MPKYKPEDLSFYRCIDYCNDCYQIFFDVDTTQGYDDNIRGEDIGEDILRNCGVDPMDESENTFDILDGFRINDVVENLRKSGFTHCTYKDESLDEDDDK